MKFALTLGILLMIFVSCADQPDFSLFHYNVRELDSTKINKENSQLQHVSAILKNYDFDILSLNEIQFDLPGVPNTNYVTKGKNLLKLQEILSLKQLKNYSFYPANTGMNAKPGPNGQYFLNPDDPVARTYADQVNFGTLPAQYSTGALYKFKKLSEVVLSKLKWKDVNPDLELGKYRNNAGEPLPAEMALFDKNFTHVTMTVKEKELNLIIFHTVPAFHFGNEKTPNYQRNHDQLRFLEWYLTGATDIAINLPNIRPLPKNSYFIVVGDLNVAPDNKEAPGSEVVGRLFKKLNPWVEQSELTFTNESSNFPPKPFRLMLDYIFTSNNIETLHGEIIQPVFDRIEAGCESKPKDKDGFKLVEYNKGDSKCFAYLGNEYYMFKEASDHFPIYGKFKFN